MNQFIKKLIFGITATSFLVLSTNSVNALNIYQSNREFLKKYTSELDSFVHEGEYLEQGNNIRAKLEQNLIKIATGKLPAPNAELVKLAQLFQQHCDLEKSGTMPCSLEVIKQRYNQEIATIHDQASFTTVKNKLEVDLALNLSTITYSTDLSPIKKQLEESVNNFCKNYSENFGWHDYGYQPAQSSGFIQAVGISFFRILATCDDLFSGKVVETVSTVATEVKNSYLDLIQKTPIFSAPSKAKLTEAFAKIPVNAWNQLQQIVDRNLDGFKELTLGENFIESTINLHRLQHSFQHEREALTHLTDANLQEIGIRSIWKFGENSDSGKCQSTPFVSFVLNDCYLDQSFAKIPGIATALGNTPENVAKELIRGIIAHELGHCLDSLCQTDNLTTDFLPLNPSPLITTDEQQTLSRLKHRLTAGLASKCRPRTKWRCEKESHKEIIADFFAYNALYLFGKNKGYSNQQISQLVTQYFPLSLFDHLRYDNSDSYRDLHPADNIRFDSILGMNHWFYNLELPLKADDSIFFPPESREQLIIS